MTGPGKRRRRHHRRQGLSQTEEHKIDARQHGEKPGVEGSGGGSVARHSPGENAGGGGVSGVGGKLQENNSNVIKRLARIKQRRRSASGNKDSNVLSKVHPPPLKKRPSNIPLGDGLLRHFALLPRDGGVEKKPCSCVMGEVTSWQAQATGIQTCTHHHRLP